MNETTLNYARDLVRELSDIFKPFVNKFRVAGSVRRRKDEPSDIDLVIVPKNLDGLIAKLKTIDPKMGGGRKYIKFHYKDIPVQVSVTNPEDIGATMLWATGPAFSNIALRRRANDMGYTLNRYGLWNDEEKITSNEKEIRKILGFQKKIYTKKGTKKMDYESKASKLLNLITEDDVRRMGTFLPPDLINKLHDPKERAELIKLAQKFYNAERHVQDDFIKDVLAQMALGHTKNIARKIALDMRSKEIKHGVHTDADIELRRGDPKAPHGRIPKPPTPIRYKEVMNNVTKMMLSKFPEKQVECQKFLTYYFVEVGFDEHIPKSSFPFYDEVRRVAKKYRWATNQAVQELGISKVYFSKFKIYIQDVMKKLYGRDYPQYFESIQEHLAVSFADYVLAEMRYLEGPDFMFESVGHMEIHAGQKLRLRYRRVDIPVEVLGLTDNDEKYSKKVKYKSVIELLHKKGVHSLDELEDLQDQADKEKGYGHHFYLVLKEEDGTIFSCYLYEGKWVVGSNADIARFDLIH